MLGTNSDHASHTCRGNWVLWLPCILPYSFRGWFRRSRQVKEPTAWLRLAGADKHIAIYAIAHLLRAPFSLAWLVPGLSSE